MSGWTPESHERCRIEEAETHRPLKAEDVFEAGDIYGGDDWGFLFVVGSQAVQKPKPGDPVGEFANSNYRFRRKK